MGHAHAAGAQTVHHIALQDAVFDEDSALVGIALVVDVAGAPAVYDGAVVDGGDLGAGHGLPHLAAHLAHADAHAGGLQAMAAGLVEDDAAEAVGDGNGHLAAGTGNGLQIHLCLTGGLGADGLGGEAGDVEEFQAHLAAGGGDALLVLAAVGCDGGDHHAGADLTVGGVKALGVGHGEGLVGGQQRAVDLDDLVTTGPGGIGGLPNQTAANHSGNVKGIGADGVDVGVDPLHQGEILDPVHGMTHSLGHPAGTLPQTAGGQVGGRGEEGTGAQEAPDAHTADDLVGDGFDLLVRIADAVVLGILGVDLGKVCAAVEHDGDQLGHCLLIKHNVGPFLL